MIALWVAGSLLSIILGGYRNAPGLAYFCGLWPVLLIGWIALNIGRLFYFAGRRARVIGDRYRARAEAATNVFRVLLAKIGGDA
jgi:hypothetical protein